MNESFHRFLCTSDGGLAERAKDIPKIRNHINNLPKTSTTFKINDIAGIDPAGGGQHVVEKHLLLCKSWPLNGNLASSNYKIYVNPHGQNIYAFSDVHVTCECGATIAQRENSERDLGMLHQEHTEECKPFMRQAVSAELSRLRWEKVQELYHYGWNNKHIASRFNCNRRDVARLIERCGHEPAKLRKEIWARAAGNTYKHLVHNADEDPEEIANVYGTTPRTLQRYYDSFGDEKVLEMEQRRTVNGNSNMWHGKYFK